MNVETTVAEDLRTVASGIAAPPPPAVADLVRRAEKERTRTRAQAAATIGLVAAAVLAVVFAGTQIGKPSSSPSPAPQPTEVPTALPTGGPPQVPYVTGSKLYVDGAAQPGAWQSVVNRGDVSLAYADQGDGVVSTIALFRDGAEVVRFGTSSASQPALLSADGSKLAWVEIGATTASLVENDASTGEELGRVRVGRGTLGHIGEENEGWESLQELSDDGTVTYGGVLATHTWKPGGDPVDHDPGFGEGNDFPGYPADAASVVISFDQSWGAWLTERNGDAITDLDRAGTGNGVTLQRPGKPQTRFTIPLPSDARGVEWESATDLLVTFFDDPDESSWHFLRCSITKRSCELAPTADGA